MGGQAVVRLMRDEIVLRIVGGEEVGSTHAPFYLSPHCLQLAFPRMFNYASIRDR